MIKQNKNNLYLSFENQNIVVYGRVCDNYSFVNENTIKFKMDNVEFVDSERRVKVSGKINVYSNAYSIDFKEFKKGRYISFVANANVYKLNSDEVSYISNNTIAKVNNVGSKITISDNFSLSLKEKVKDFIYNKLEKSNLKYSGIAYAMIFGDTTFIDEKVEDIFRDGGISHLLAVSGLNITILIFIIAFILKRLKVNKKASFVINVLFIVIYTYFCDFTPSIVRASIMAIVKLIADLKHKPYDGLSALSFSAFLILLINQLKMYNYSFILSYFSVFVIILLNFPIQKSMNKYFYKSFSDAISLNLSIGLGLSLIQLFLFGQIPLLSMIVNIVSVPIVLYAFIYLLIIFVIVLIFPFLSSAYGVFDFAISIVVKFSNFINNFGLMIYNYNIDFSLVIIFVLFIFNISPLVFQKKELKLKQSIIMIILAIIIQTKMIF